MAGCGTMAAVDTGFEIDSHAPVEFPDEGLPRGLDALGVGHRRQLGMLAEMRQLLGKLLEDFHIDRHAFTPLR
jgi:hypothetical protein